MAKLIYATPTSLDGYSADENYDWAAPDEVGFAFINDLERPTAMYLYERKMHLTMRSGRCQTSFIQMSVLLGPPAMLDLARTWQAADKLAYSKSLGSVCTPKTRLAQEFDPQAVRDLKAQLPHNVSNGRSDPRCARDPGPGSSTRFNCYLCLLRLAAASGSCQATYA